MPAGQQGSLSCTHKSAASSDPLGQKRGPTSRLSACLPGACLPAVPPTGRRRRRLSLAVLTMALHASIGYSCDAIALGRGGCRAHEGGWRCHRRPRRTGSKPLPREWEACDILSKHGRAIASAADPSGSPPPLRGSLLIAGLILATLETPYPNLLLALQARGEIQNNQCCQFSWSPDI